MHERRITRWARWLFVDKARERPGQRLGRDFGFTGQAASIPVGRLYKLDDKWPVPHARRHLRAASNVLAYAVKHAYELASERGDRQALEFLDKVHNDLADRMLIAAERVSQVMSRRGYAGHFGPGDPGPGAG